MRHLLLKDLMLQKRNLAVVFIYVIILSFIFPKSGGIVAVFGIGMVGNLLLMFSTAWEAMGDVLWNSLPIPKWKIVGAKYLAIFVYMAIALALIFLFSSVSMFFGTSWIDITRSFSHVQSGLLVVILLTCLYWPVYFALGLVKSRYANIALYIALFYLFKSGGSFL